MRLGPFLFAALLTGAATHVSAAPSATCSTRLADGRSFLTGGTTSAAPNANPIAIAHFFENDGSLKPAAPMLAARAAHVCIALQDSSILVAGGVSGPGGPTNSAEIYDPKTDNGGPTGAMLTARTSAAAILLKDGRVLVSGGDYSGQIANTLEIYDPAENRFRVARDVLSSARAGHAIALLNDGRILIAGGTDGGRVLNTIDIFDPATEAIRPAGFMTSPRSDFTATTLAGWPRSLRRWFRR